VLPLTSVLLLNKQMFFPLTPIFSVICLFVHTHTNTLQQRIQTCINSSNDINQNENITPQCLAEYNSDKTNLSSRRNVVAAMAQLMVPSIAIMPTFSSKSWAYGMGIQTLRLNSPQDRLGLELTEVQIGNPQRTVLAVKSVDPFGMAAKQSIEKGLVIEDYPNATALIGRIRSGPYPVDINFKNLGGGGDAYGDLGKTIVSQEDALKLAERIAGEDRTSDGSNSSGYDIRTLRKPNLCSVTSRRGDVMEIQYIASYYIEGNKDGAKVYDSSAQRGTGLPYQMVLGSGDMLPGVDQGMYQMCPGEKREIDIPKQLGYGDKGNKLFRIPGGVRLFWEVELVALNSLKEGDNNVLGD